MKRFQRVELWALLVVLAIALALRLWGIGFGLPHRYHIDEPPYVVAALRIASGDLNITYPYNSPNLFELLLTGIYGVWYITGKLLGVFQTPSDLAALYQTDPSWFYLFARALSVFFSIVTVALLYAIGRRLSGRWLGFLAAVFLAFAFGHARDAHYAVTDTMVTALVVASLLGAILSVQLRKKRYLILSGMAGGMAVGLKYLPAPILLPPLVLLIEFWRESKRRGEWIKTLLMFVGSVSAGFLIAFPAPLISFHLFQVQWQQTWAQAAGPLGNIRVDTAPAPLYYLKTFIWGLGAPLLIAAMIGLFLRLRRQWSTGYAYVLLFVVTCFMGISLVQTAFARYALPLVPFLALFAAEAVVQVLRLLRSHTTSRVPAVVGIFLILSIVAIPGMKLVRHDWLLTQIDTRTLALKWVEAHIPAGERIAMQWYGPPLSTADDHEPATQRAYHIVMIDPFDTRAATYDLDTYRGAGVTYLIMNDWAMSFQHRDPEQNLLRQRFYAQLRTEARPVAVSRPTADATSIPFVFEQIYGPYTSVWKITRPGPTIVVYSLKP